MASQSVTSIVIALAVGFVPIFFWLWFWLRNDHNPEPRGFLALAFIAGAVVVGLVIPLENLVFNVLGDSSLGIIGIAAIEEVLKFLPIAALVFASRYVNEPIDYGIYLITAALGFAALENTLFLANPIHAENVTTLLTLGNIRFLGATVMHAVSAAVIGISMGIVFYKPKVVRGLFAIIGLISAIALHSLFNYFIMDGSTQNLIISLVILWIVGIIIVSMFRRLAELQPIRPR